MSDDKPKRPPWCPSKYRPEFCEQIVEMGREGFSFAEMSAGLGATRDTLKNWADQHEDFFVALKQARELSQAWWESQGRTHLINEPQGPTINASLYSRSMAARFPDDWRENTKVEHTGKDGGALVIERVIVDPGKNGTETQD